MKKFSLRMTVIVMIIAIGFVMMSCEDEKPRDALFESQTGDYSIMVSNKSSSDLVAYAGSLKMSNRIGGITAKTDNFRLPKDPQIFPTTPKSFQMLFITRAQYEQSGHSDTALASLANSVLIRTYVFWNGSAGDNEKVYEISDKLGGMHRLQIFGPGNYDVEFRERGVAGPTLGYAPAKMSLTYLSVGPGDYFLYPVFQRYNQRRDIMETIIPVRPAQGGSPEGPFNYSFSFSANATTQQTRMLNLSEASGYLSKMQTGVVYVYVNNASGGGITAYNGSIPMTTPDGNQIINNGEFQEFAILLPQQGNTYLSSISANFQILYNVSTPLDVVSEQSYGTANPVKSLTLKGDMMYTLNIKAENGVKATIELREGQENGPVPFQPEDSVNGLTAPQ